MIIALIVILTIVIALILLRRNRYSKTPEFLKGRKVYQYLDLMTHRKIYVAVTRSQNSKLRNEAYYMDDESVCLRALVRQPYGFMYFENGELRAVPKSFALNLLERIQKGTIPTRKKGSKLQENTQKNDEPAN